MTLTTTDLRYLRNALNIVGRTLLRIDNTILCISVTRAALPARAGTVKVTIHNHRSTEGVFAQDGLPELMLDPASAAISRHLTTLRTRAARGEVNA